MTGSELTITGTNRDGGGRYSGQYLYDEATDVVTGCPARAPAVHNIMKAIKTMSRVKGLSANRQHAEAITIEELTYVMLWSEAQSPRHLLCDDRKRASYFRDQQMLFHVVRHGLMRAFMSTAFTLWTRYVGSHFLGLFFGADCCRWGDLSRNNELCGLRARDIVWDCFLPPYTAQYFTVTLANRKGWQKQVGHNGPSDGESTPYYVGVLVSR